MNRHVWAEGDLVIEEEPLGPALTKLAQEYVKPHPSISSTGKPELVRGYWRDGGDVLPSATVPFTWNFRSDMSPENMRKSYVARITGGSAVTQRFTREFLDGGWRKVGQQSQPTLTGAQRQIDTWTVDLPQVDGVYEVQSFKPDPHGHGNDITNRTLFVVHGGVAEEAPWDPDEVQSIIDGGIAPLSALAKLARIWVTPHPSVSSTGKVEHVDGYWRNIKGAWVPLIDQAKQYNDFESFQRDFVGRNFHGTYWHLTQDPNFKINPLQAPREGSSMGATNVRPGLMVTTDLANWKSVLGPSRKYVAQVEVPGGKPGTDYWDTTRGFGQETWIDNPKIAKVVKVMPYAAAQKKAYSFYEGGGLPQNEEELHHIWDLAHPKTGLDISVPAATLKPGTSLENGVDVKQTTGAPVRGLEVIAPTDPRIPDTVYHVTTNLPAVRKSDALKAAGAGGLGGDSSDHVVSMTTDPKIAHQIASDIQLEARMRKMEKSRPPTEYLGKGNYSDAPVPWSQKVTTILESEAKRQGFELPSSSWADSQRQTYKAHDYMNYFFVRRETETGIQNPIIFQFGDGPGPDPAKVGVVAVPKANLDNGALLTNFDLGRKSGLSEVRSYGDVSLHGATFEETKPPPVNRVDVVPEKAQDKQVYYRDGLRITSHPDGTSTVRGWHAQAKPGLARAGEFHLGSLQAATDAVETSGVNREDAHFYEVEVSGRFAGVDKPWVDTGWTQHPPGAPDRGTSNAEAVAKLQSKGVVGAVYQNAHEDTGFDSLSVVLFDAGSALQVGQKAPENPLTATLGPIPNPWGDNTLSFDEKQRMVHEWISRAQYQMAIGKISGDRARKLGYKELNADESIEKLPQTLYHATTALDAVHAQGLKTRQELAQGLGHGLGGGTDDTISFTTDKKIADEIGSSILEARSVIRGDTTVQSLVDTAKRQGFAKGLRLDEPAGREFAQLLNETPMHPEFVGMLRTEAEVKKQFGPGPWTPFPGAPGIPGGDGKTRYMKWQRPMTPDEIGEARFEAYKTFAAYREEKTGKLSPLFFLADWKAIRDVSPDQVGVVKVHPVAGAQGYQVSSLGEWRTWSGDAVKVDPADKLKAVAKKATPEPPDSALIVAVRAHKTGYETQTGNTAIAPSAPGTIEKMRQTIADAVRVAPPSTVTLYRGHYFDRNAVRNQIGQPPPEVGQVIDFGQFVSASAGEAQARDKAGPRDAPSAAPFVFIIPPGTRAIDTNALLKTDAKSFGLDYGFEQEHLVAGRFRIAKIEQRNGLSYATLEPSNARTSIMPLKELAGGQHMKDLSPGATALVNARLAKDGVSIPALTNEIATRIGGPDSKVMQEAKVWYPGADDLAVRISKTNVGVSHEQAAALISATSPQAQWELNAETAARMAQWYGIAKAKGIPPDKLTAEFKKAWLAQGWGGQKLDGENAKNRELAANITRGFEILSGASIDETLPSIKMRSFYNNIILRGKGDDVTVDVHMGKAYGYAHGLSKTVVKALMAKGSATKAVVHKNGNVVEDTQVQSVGYVAIAEAVRALSHQPGWDVPPSTIQAAYWILVRDEFPKGWPASVAEPMMKTPLVDELLKKVT